MRSFRQIRSNILNTNKTGQYLKYAIGEILLVVVGILIALQINNWNEERKQNIAETEFLKGIANDLAQDQDYIQIVLNRLKPKIEAFDILNNQLINSSEENTILTDSLLSIYLFRGQRTFYPVSGSFQSAIAGNELNNFHKKEVINYLITLYNSTYPRLIDNANILDRRWDKLSEKYLQERRTKSFSIETREQATEIVNDLYYHYLQMIWYQEVLLNTSEEVELIVEMLDDKIL